jgi:hypothetical protein
VKKSSLMLFSYYRRWPGTRFWCNGLIATRRHGTHQVI